MKNMDLLNISNLTVSFRIDQKYYAAVDGISLSVNKNEVFAIVGESGCGKSALALSIMNLHNLNYTKISGDILFNGSNLLNLNEKELNEVRGRDIGMIFQDPLTALNPLMKIGAQIEESLSLHTKLSSKEKADHTVNLLKDTGIKNPELTYNQYPHELSGGMRQRAMIAIALACKPSLVIADEPTTALDVTIQAQILQLLKKLQKEMKSGIILITHDLGVVAEMADKVAVMYAGQIVEIGSVNDIFKSPKHPYTKSLLASMPSIDTQKEDANLRTIHGMVPSLLKLKRTGCRFSPRIPWINENAHEKNPEYHEVSPNHYVLCSCYKTFHFENEKEGA